MTLSASPFRVNLVSAGGTAFETLLNFRVAAPSRYFEGAVGLTFPALVFDSADRVDANQCLFGIGVEGKTARLFTRAPSRAHTRGHSLG